MYDGAKFVLPVRNEFKETTRLNFEKEKREKNTQKAFIFPLVLVGWLIGVAFHPEFMIGKAASESSIYNSSSSSSSCKRVMSDLFMK